MPGKQQTGFDLLIIGASVCGLATAIALAQKGHRVRVLEEQPALNDLGASVTFLPAATRLLVAWGLDQSFKEYVTPIRCFTSKDGATGEVIGRAPCNIGNNAQIRYGAEWWNIHRSHCLMLLAQAAERLGAEIVFNAKLEDIHIEGVRAVCTDGREFSADIIIGADGLNSTTRKHIPTISGVRINEWLHHNYLCLVPKEHMFGNPLLESLLDTSKLDGTSYVLEGKYFLTWPMQPDMPFEMVASVSGQDIDLPAGKWGTRALPEEVIGHLSHFCAEITEPMKHVDQVLKWSSGDLPVLATWCSPNGRVVLAGDAAHAVIPHAAQGPSGAIEDAAVLAETLTWAFQHSRSIKSATEAYERIRKPRATRMQEISCMHYRSLVAGGDAAKARNAAFSGLDKQMWENLKVPEEVRREEPKPPQDMSAHFPGQWIYGYDAIFETRKYLAELD